MLQQAQENTNEISLRAPDSGRNRVLAKPDFSDVPQTEVKNRIRNFLDRARTLPECAPDASEPAVLDINDNYSSGEHDESLGVIMDIIGIGPTESQERAESGETT